MFVFILAVATALVSSFVCSISEAVLLSVGHAQIETLSNTGAADIFRRFKREIDLPIAAVLTLNTTAHTIGASVAGAYYGDVFDPSTLWVFSVAFTLGVLVFSEIIPKTVGVAWAGSLAVPVAYGVAGLVFVLRPLLFVTRAIAKAFTKGAAVNPITSIEEITLLAGLGRTEGVVTTVTADMIEGVAALRDLRARDVMVPRARVTYLSGQRTFEENLEVVRRTGHSRFPYSPTGDLDRVEGVVLVKDLMFTMLEQHGKADLPHLAAKALMVPATTTLERLLRNFQIERRHMAIVVDEYGGTEGIVTLEDVLEEIVGEIEDESDRVDRLVTKRADGTLVCRGWAEARAVLDELEVDPETDAVTIGGLVAELVGRVPRPGDTVDWNGLHFLVTQASPRRAERVEIRRLQAEAKASPEET